MCDASQPARCTLTEASYDWSPSKPISPWYICYLKMPCPRTCHIVKCQVRWPMYIQWWPVSTFQNLDFFLIWKLQIFIFSYFCVWNAWVGAPWSMCGSQRTTCINSYLLPRTKMSSGLAANTPTHWAILPALGFFLLFFFKHHFGGSELGSSRPHVQDKHFFHWTISPVLSTKLLLQVVHKLASIRITSRVC